MAIVLKWFRALRWSYWRRCKACYLRGSKCLCRRPSVMLDHMLYVDDRKNKFGVRNFSHVSDTAVSSGSGSGSSGTVLSTGTSFGADYPPGEFYRTTQKQPLTTSTTALVRKNAGTMVPMRSYSQDDMNYNYSGEYTDYYHDPTTRHATRATRRPLPHSTSTYGNAYADESSLQIYSRHPQRAARSASRGSTRMSSGDSLVVRPSSSSSVRASITSDRMSVDNNIGSFNPQSRFYGAAYAPSIQEDDDDAQTRLNGLLQMPSPASSTSTLLERSRYNQYY